MKGSIVTSRKIGSEVTGGMRSFDLYRKLGRWVGNRDSPEGRIGPGFLRYGYNTSVDNG